MHKTALCEKPLMILCGKNSVVMLKWLKIISNWLAPKKVNKKTHISTMAWVDKSENSYLKPIIFFPPGHVMEKKKIFVLKHGRESQ